MVGTAAATSVNSAHRKTIASRSPRGAFDYADFGSGRHEHQDKQSDQRKEQHCLALQHVNKALRSPDPPMPTEATYQDRRIDIRSGCQPG
jgi:hypothetical protein